MPFFFPFYRPCVFWRQKGCLGNSLHLPAEIALDLFPTIEKTNALVPGWATCVGEAVRGAGNTYCWHGKPENSGNCVCRSMSRRERGALRRPCRANDLETEVILSYFPTAQTNKIIGEEKPHPETRPLASLVKSHWSKRSE